MDELGLDKLGCRTRLGCIGTKERRMAIWRYIAISLARCLVIQIRIIAWQRLQGNIHRTERMIIQQTERQYMAWEDTNRFWISSSLHVGSATLKMIQNAQLFFLLVKACVAETVTLPDLDFQK